MMQNGRAIVMDFGIARAITTAGGPRLTETGIIIGTPKYMSPEQAAGDKELDKRSDIYAFGCVVYEMLTGGPPFTGPNAQVVMARHALEDPPGIRPIRPEVPEHVELSIRRAMAKDPDDRFPNAARFGDALMGRGPVEDPEPEKRESRISSAFKSLFKRGE
jgi:serine/threonine-protein kinase